MKLYYLFKKFFVVIVATTLAHLSAAHLESAIIHVNDQGFSIAEKSGDIVPINFGGREGSLTFADGVSGFMMVTSGTVHEFAFFLFSDGIVSVRLAHGFQFGESIDGGFASSGWTDTGSAGLLLYPDGDGNFPDGEGHFFDTERYVGVRIVDELDFLYAWIRVSHDSDARLLTVHEWAWNTVPNEPILAGQIPEPATVALLAGLGALLIAGVARWRRRKL